MFVVSRGRARKCSRKFASTYMLIFFGAWLQCFISILSFLPLAGAVSGNASFDIRPVNSMEGLCNPLAVILGLLFCRIPTARHRPVRPSYEPYGILRPTKEVSYSCMTRAPHGEQTSRVYHVYFITCMEPWSCPNHAAPHVHMFQAVSLHHRDFPRVS